MKSIYSLINKLNIIVAKLVAILIALYKRIIPVKLQKKIKTTINNYLVSSEAFLRKIKTRSNQYKLKVKSLKKSDRSPLETMHIAFDKMTIFFKSINIKKLNIKKISTFLSMFGKKYITPSITKFQIWFTNLRPGNMLLVLFLFTVTALFILAVIFESRKIYIGQALIGHNELEIIKVQPSKSKIRTSYFRRVLPQKQIDVHEITFPIYIESINSVRTLIIDITLETSNRYLAKFFENNSRLLYDRFHTSFHPIIPSFPLTNEGKQVIRQKIIDEINTLIKELGLDGHINAVYFQNIIMAYYWPRQDNGAKLAC